MVIDADGHLFATEAVFEKYMASGFRRRDDVPESAKDRILEGSARNSCGQ